MPLEAVDYDPFAASSGGTVTIPGQNGAPTRVIMEMGQGKRLEPVDHDPFAQSASDMGTGLLRAFDSGAEKMLAGTAGALGDITDLGAQGIGAASDYISEKLGIPKYERPKTPSFLDAIPRSADMQRHLSQKYRGDENASPYQSQNGKERYAHAAGEFLLGGVGGIGRKAFQRLGQIALPSTISETAGHALEGSKYEPAARFGGALVGGGLAALTSRPGTAANSLSQQMPAGVTPQMVDQAGSLIASAKQRGIDLAWPEALSQVAGKPVLTNMMRHLEASPQTEAQMGAFFGQRPQQVEGAVRREFDNIAPINRAPDSIGPEVGRAAQETVKDVRQTINKVSDPYYKAADPQTYTPQEFAIVQSIPGYKEAIKAVREAPDAWRIQHLPDESIGVLNKVKQHFDQQAKNAGSKFNPAQNQSVQSSHEMAASATRQVGIAKSAEYETALAIQETGRKEFLQPMLDGPLGKLAKKDVSTKKAIEVLFPRDPLANSEDAIGQAVREVAKRHPRAASDLVRAHAEKTFNEAARDLQTGPNQANGAKFRAAIVGNPQQRMNLRAAVEELPNGQARWQGFNKLLEALEATGARQGIGSRTAYNAEINKAQAAGGLVREGTKVVANPMKFLQPLADKYDQYKLGKNLSELANILTDPRSGAMLKSISAMPSGSMSGQMVALKLLTYANAAAVQKPN